MIRAYSHLVIALVIALGSLTGCGSSKKKDGGDETDDSITFYQTGIDFLHRGRPDRALDAFLEAQRLDPDSPIIAYGVGLAQLGKRDFLAASNAFSRVLELDRYMTDARNNLGIAYIELGERDRAMREFQQVLADSRYKTPEVPKFNIGRLLLEAGRAEESVVYLKSASQSKPERADWRYQFAAALVAVDRLVEAKVELEAVLVAKPDYPEAHFLVGEVYEREGDPERAKQHFSRVSEIVPGTALAEQARARLGRVP